MEKVKQISKKLVVWLVALAMLITLVPTVAFAEGEEGGTKDSVTVIVYTNRETDKAWFTDGESQRTNSYSEQVPLNENVADYLYLPEYDSSEVSFVEWSLDKDADPSDVSGTFEYYVDENSPDPLEVYAIWKDAIHITLDAGEVGYFYDEGEPVGSQSLNVFPDDSISLDTPYSTNPFAIFEGWFDASGTQYEEISGSSFATDTTLYAKWNIPEITEISYGEMFAVSGTGSECKYYKFTVPENRYYKLYTSGNTRYNEDYDYEESICEPSLELYDEYGNILSSSERIENDNIKILAELESGRPYYLKAWDYRSSDEYSFTVHFETAEMATVTFHAQGEAYLNQVWNSDTEEYEIIREMTSVLEEGSTIDPGLQYAYKENTEDGKEFIGWSTQPNASLPEQNITVSEGLNLYDVWGSYVTVNYVPDYEKGGYMDGSDEYQVVSGSAFNPIVPGNDNDLYEFEGWYTEQNGKGTKLDETFVVTENMTVYANWVVNLEAEALSLDTPVQISGNNGDEHWFSFTPAENGFYKFYSFDNTMGSEEDGEYYTPYASLYDSNLNYLDSDSYTGPHNNFSMLNELTAGQTYYFKVTEDEGWSNYHFKVMITKPEMVNVTFYANHEGAYFYDPESGNQVPSRTQKCEANVRISSYTTPNLDSSGYAFVGWALTEDATEPADMYEIKATEGLALYGVWKKNVTVTIHLNNPEDYESGNAYFYVYNPSTGEEEPSDTNTYTYTEGSEFYSWNLTSPNYNMENVTYEFKGFSEDPNAKEPQETFVAREGMELYCIWAKYYTISYDATDGYFRMDGDTPVTTYSSGYAEGSKFVGTEVYHTNPFASFEGWYTEKDGGEKYDSNTVISGDVTLYAHWEIVEPIGIDHGVLTQAVSEKNKIVYTFTPAETGTYSFTTADVDYQVPNVILYNSNHEDVTAQLGTVTEVNSDCSNVVLICNLTAGETYYLALSNHTNYGFRYPIKIQQLKTANVIFRANREGAAFYLGEEDQAETLQRTGAVGTRITNIDVPETNEANIRFAGWSEDPDASSGSNFSSCLVKKDTTYYAVWKETTGVTFHANNDNAYYDTDEDEDGNVSYIRTYSYNYDIGSVINSDDGHEFNVSGDYTFLGWASTADATEPEENIVVTADITDLYAVWQEGVAPPVGPEPDEITIELNKQTMLTTESNAVWLKFTPEESGLYTIESTGNYDSYVELYREGKTGSRIAYDDDGGSYGNNFRLSYELEAGVTYYYKARLYNESRYGFSYSVLLTKPATFNVTFDVNAESLEEAWFADDAGNHSLTKVETYVENDIVSFSEYSYLIQRAENNKKFVGWSEDPDAETAGYNIRVTKDMTLYAIWADRVSVTFVINRADGNAWFEYDVNNDKQSSYELSFVKAMLRPLSMCPYPGPKASFRSLRK